MADGTAMARAYGGEPVLVMVIGVTGGTATIERDGRRGTFLVRDLYRYDERLLHQLRQAYLQTDSAALERVWTRATPYAEANKSA